MVKPEALPSGVQSTCIMAQDRSPGDDLWRHTLSQIPTVFGRLFYLASLRDPHTGQYAHFGFAQRVGLDSSDAILRNSHFSTFQDWLCLSLAGQKDDLEEYLASLRDDRSSVIATWLGLEPYRGWIPLDTRTAERDLYICDLRTVLEILRNAYGVASPDPDA